MEKRLRLRIDICTRRWWLAPPRVLSLNPNFRSLPQNINGAHVPMYTGTSALTVRPSRCVFVLRGSSIAVLLKSLDATSSCALKAQIKTLNRAAVFIPRSVPRQSLRLN